MFRHKHFVLLAIASALALGACGKSPEGPAAQDAAKAAPAENAPDAALAAKEQELAQREKEVADREAALVAQQAEQEKATPAPAPTKPATSVPPKKNPPAVAAGSPSTTPKPVKPVVTPIVVPAGTQLTVALVSDLSTKTAKAGDTFETRLVSDVLVDGRLAAATGSTVTGTVTDVISGSQKIGGIPTLGLRFDSLVLENGQKIAINGELVEKGKSDTARDTAKIVGGAAAGAIIGHQIKGGDGGKIVGGIVGGAIGAAIAKNTGTEVVLPANSTLTIALSAPIEIKPR